MGEFMKLRHFIAIGSSGDFGEERVWINVASKWGVKNTRNHSRRIRATVALKIDQLFALTGREHSCGGK